jgi:hypothetical protein
MIAATAVGLAAAFVFALSALLQQRAARRSLGGDVGALRHAAGVRRLFGALVRSRTWLAGWLTNLCGVAAQAAALKIGGARPPFVLASSGWPPPRPPGRSTPVRPSKACDATESDMGRRAVLGLR